MDGLAGEWVRSISAKTAGDPVAARKFRLVPPGTGVCGVRPVISAAKAEAGCGCGPKALVGRKHAILHART
jgi:hypothetical protein